jgi:outer membrane protein
MKRTFAIVLMIAGFLVAGASNTQAQNKIGYIDVNELIASMPAAKKADSLLQQFYAALVENANEKNTSLNNAIKKFNEDSGKLSSAVKEVRRKDLQNMVNEMSGLEQKLQNDYEAKKQELSDPIRKDAQAAIQAVAKTNGYNYVFYKEAVIVSPPADDLLPLVKKYMNIKEK